jgi:hypothetical protein
MRAFRKAVAITLGSLAMATIAAGCSSSSGSTGTTTTTAPSNNPNSGSTSSTTPPLAPSAEYLSLVAPVDSARVNFETTHDTSAVTTSAGTFSQALQTWSTGLKGYSWPTSDQAAITRIENEIPPVATGLGEIASGTIDYDQFIFRYGSASSQLSSASENARSVLGLPPAT